MKYIIYIICIILLSCIAWGLQECKGTVTTDEIPCLVLLPLNVTETPCNTIQVDFYNESSLQYSQAMHPYNTFACNSTFNKTEISTYTFIFSTGDTGSIIVEEGINMILLLYFALAFAVILLIIGLLAKDTTVGSIAGILMLVIGVFLSINGFSETNNLITQATGIVGITVGGYTLIKANMENFME